MSRPVAAALLGCAVLASAGCGTGDGVGGSSCSVSVLYEGRTYGGAGDLKRFPDPSQGAAEGRYVSCGDGPGWPVTVNALPGIAPTVALAVDDALFIAADSTYPQAVRPFLDEVTCETAGTFTLSGQWLATSGPRTEGFTPEPPWRVVLRVQSTTPQAEEYERTEITVAVSTATRLDDGARAGGTSESAPVTAELRCDGRRFAATSLHF